MKGNIIKVTPNDKGEIFITLFGTRYQIVVEEKKDKKSKGKEKPIDKQ